ncbi:concanavalin A-like lectin/glucanase domain-containing protein [Desarmillaria tabescens]|uniref:Concanavalin A-like lectin/glucanase domain-containing protein n=1 Tax=Armillaria tabescens TaxID=1929756 RepID=A0AA39JL77_ARMTA|nr:concanavalin A-like lectin/glucanase domain-containing protein [Desarmillaria tabescens]KAK0443985.1 concanavalin A-like lectin/glucanase domain-containing protein [Desarmillaria tabescens]
MKILTLILLLARILFTHALYAPLREYAGQSFFSGWNFPGNYDNTTWGNVTFVDQTTASMNKLAYVNDAGNAILRVDNTTDITGTGLIYRDSVKLTSQDLYPLGSLITIDLIHMPYGCSVWPSFWTFGGTDLEWPMYGEIDIIEGINLNANNQMALHHNDSSCVQSPNPGQSGKTVNADCTNGDPVGATGCAVTETKPNSFGESFSQNGGGVFALQFDVSGAFIWFWSRQNIPKSITSATSTSNMDTTDWGTPSASYPSSGCDLQKLFKPQKLILDITLCGTWAGIPSIFNTQCSGQCVQDYIMGPGSPKYDNAWFKISYIRTYSAAAGNATSSGVVSTATGTTTHVVTSTSGRATASASATATSSPSSAGRPHSTISWVLVVSLLCLVSLGL